MINFTGTMNLKSYKDRNVVKPKISMNKSLSIENENNLFLYYQPTFQDLLVVKV